MQADQDESENVYSVYDWLNDYTVRRSEMTPKQQAEEDRKDYHEDSQVYCDYLDYVDEWQWHAREQKETLISSYIYDLSKHHREAKCKCGKNHVFTRLDQPEKGDVVVDDPTNIMYHTCWYRYICDQVEETLQYVNSHQNTARLPNLIERIMVRVTMWKMVDAQQTPILLPYQAFKRVWWEKNAKGSVSAVAKELLAQLTQADRLDIQAAREQNRVSVPEKQQKKLLDFPHSEHGMHNLKWALSDAHFEEVWAFINRHRVLVGKPSDAISKTELAERMRKCNICTKIKSGIFKTPKISHPGIYYAPPGLGKTTAMNRGLLIGLDTDWLGVGPTWEDYAPILNLGIPIVTNQYNVFIGSGLKIIGVIGDHIREDSEGNPFTTVAKLQEFERYHSKDVIFIYVKAGKYLADKLHMIFLMQIMQSMIATYAINQQPFYQNTTDEEWTRKFPKLLRKEVLQPT